MKCLIWVLNIWQLQLCVFPEPQHGTPLQFSPPQDIELNLILLTLFLGHGELKALQPFTLHINLLPSSRIKAPYWLGQVLLMKQLIQTFVHIIAHKNNYG